MQKPKVEHIERPVAGHRHRAEEPRAHARARPSARSPRSTTTCASCMARLGQPHCPDCDIPVGTQTADEIIDKILAEPAGTQAVPDGPGRDRTVGEKYDDAVGRAAGDRLRPRARRRRRRTRSTSRRRSTTAASTWSKWSSTASSCEPTAASRIADTVENGARPGQGRAARRLRRTTTCPRPKWRVERSQPAPRLRPLRPQLRAAHAAQLLVQQPARLVPDVRRAGRADRRQPGRCCSAIPS